MKTLEIKKVQIKDFRCIEHLCFDLGKQIKIYSDNEGGKSTIASAITWCLNGKNIENQSTFDIVPYGKQGLVSPKVELECLINGETPLTLTRIYQAKFTRDKQFSKYDTVCLINGLEVGVNKFQEYISTNICDERVFKILSVPKTFIEECPKQTKELLWQAQRRMLMKIAGNDVKDIDIAYADGKYFLLEEPLKRYGDINTYLTYLKKELASTEKEISSFESKLAQQEKNVVESKYRSTKEIQAELECVSNDKENLIRLNEEHKQQGQSDKKDKLTKRYEELKVERDNFHQEYLARLRKYDNDKKAIEIKIAEKQSAINKLINTQNEYVKALETLKNSKVKTVCETCKQPLTKEMVERSKNNILARIKKGQDMLGNLKQQQLEVKQEMDALSKSLLSLQEPVRPAKEMEIAQEIEKVMIESMNIPAVDNLDGYTEKIVEFDKAISELHEQKIILAQNEKCELMIKQLEEENREYITKYSELQQLVDLSKDFISYKCSKAENNINNLFDNVRFELFEKNKSNDDIKETCIMKYNGIKYNDLSLSTKLIANIEIIKMFQKYYNVAVPIIIDNMESITQPLNIDCQIIGMYVKEENCPVCGGKSDRRNTDTGLWKCKSCGNEWAKKLDIKNSQGAAE